MGMVIATYHISPQQFIPLRVRTGLGKRTEEHVRTETSVNVIEREFCSKSHLLCL